MGAFFKTLANRGDRKQKLDTFCNNFYSKFRKSLPQECRDWYKSNLLAIYAGSNKGSTEDCIFIMHRDLEKLLKTYELSYEEKKYFLSSLRGECFNGSTEKYGYWWAKEIIDGYIGML